MDYTLARNADIDILFNTKLQIYLEYKSPQYEELAFDIIKCRLIKLGYPSKIAEYTYDPSFPLRSVDFERSIVYFICSRGLWFDRLYGTLLKMDQFGNILSCLRGFYLIQREELRAMYPNKFVKFDEKRIEIMNTLFSLPETYMLSCVINHFVSDADYIKTEHGLKKGTLYMSYASIYEDVKAACDWMHTVISVLYFHVIITDGHSDRQSD
ncbi:unnamed protein product [Trichobilharzia regenti]|nr:unnamed protein product [Trichobilharzia regenti]